jgi:spore germination protein GerM
MIKRKWLIPFGLIVALIPVAVAVALLVNARGGGTSGGLPVFYYNAPLRRLETVPVQPADAPPMAQINELLGRFYTPPPGLTGLWPQELGLVALAYHEETETVGLALPPGFRELTPLAQALLRTGLTLTLTGLPFVEQVLFWVDGEGNKPPVHFAEWFVNEEYWDINALKIESTATVANHPVISPGVMRSRTITLYFVCESGEKLVTETFVDDYVDLHRLAEEKLQYLIAGPIEEGALRLIPPETRIRVVTLDRATNSVYVDLSGDFVSRFIGSPKLAHLMLQSIVNTLTLPGNNNVPVRQVFFLVDSQRIDIFHGVGGFDLAFLYDHEIMLVEEDEPGEDPDENEEDDVPVGPRGDEEE